MTTDASLRDLHQVYCTLTNLNLPWQNSHLFAWELFGLRFTEADLRLVINYLKEKQRKGRPVRSFTFRNFISGPSALDFFGEDLAEAKAMSRAPKPHLATSVLRATGRTMPEPDRVRSAAAIIKGDEALKRLLELRDNL